MKITYMIFFLLLTLRSSAQINFKNIKKQIPSLTSTFFAGASDGTTETLQHHYYEFKRIFPNSNDQFWNPDLSWRNKYKNGDNRQGSKFLFSTNLLVWTTDGYHLTRFSRNTMLVTTFLLFPREKTTFKNHVINVILHTISYKSGFYVTYNLLYQNPNR